eukprot:TRINITY_DN67463_c0_g1_i1.p1 TRINITY_DN67463_c0_g1~~TRINITY_DN67463_c0_g1_i1.p1  ORF type:complete len:397 (-),score=60.55 TRINITY_DN67463_c0_g1_i1:40-1230(-)
MAAEKGVAAPPTRTHRADRHLVLFESDELGAALRAYMGGVVELPRAGAAGAPRVAGRRKPPRTHLHAEMVRKRRTPEPSPKTHVEEALRALSAGDEAAVEAILKRDGEIPVPEQWQQRYKGDGQTYWDQFYIERTVNFFKDRNYLREEFGELMPPEILEDPRRWVKPLEEEMVLGQPPRTLQEALVALEGRRVLLEVGCAVGNGVLPMLRACPDLFGFACDLSPVAIQLLQEKEEYRCGRCLAFACDVTRGELEQPTEHHAPIETMVPANSVDFSTLLFVLSAIDPPLHRGVLARIAGRLRPGGMLMVRDYGRGDLAQLRFSPGHWLGGDVYVRGDGTLAVFLTVEGLVAEAEAAGFEVLECEYRRNEIVNRGTGLRMPRVWVQGKFRRRMNCAPA